MDFENLLQRYRESAASSSDAAGISNEASSSTTTTTAPARKITTDMILDRLRNPSSSVESNPSDPPTPAQVPILQNGHQEIDIEKLLSDTGGRPSSTAHLSQSPPILPLPTDQKPNTVSSTSSMSLADILGGGLSYPPPLQNPVTPSTTDPIVLPQSSQDIFTALAKIEALAEPDTAPREERASTPNPPSSSPEEVLSQDIQNAQAIEELKAKIRDEITQKYLSRAEIDEKVLHCVEICDSMRETVTDLKKRFFEIELHFRFLRQIMAVDDSEIEMYVRDLQAQTAVAVSPIEPLRVFPVSQASTPPVSLEAKSDVRPSVKEVSSDPSILSVSESPPTPTVTGVEETTTTSFRPLVVQSSQRSTLPTLQSAPPMTTPHASTTVATDTPSDPAEKRTASVVRPRPLLPAPPSKNPMNRFQKTGYSSTYANVFPVI